jgi:hypothetical protein
MKALLLAVPLFASACDSARVAGGRVVANGVAPAGTVAGSWSPFDCRDARGDPFASERTAIELLRTPDGRFVLVEARPPDDSFVVTNSFVRGQERVFQLALKSASNAPYLREYRLPLVGTGPGRLVVVGRQWDSRDTDDGFVAWYAAKPAFSCALLQGRTGGT